MPTWIAGSNPACAMLKQATKESVMIFKRTTTFTEPESDSVKVLELKKTTTIAEINEFLYDVHIGAMVTPGGLFLKRIDYTSWEGRAFFGETLYLEGEDEDFTLWTNPDGRRFDVLKDTDDGDSVF